MTLENKKQMKNLVKQYIHPIVNNESLFTGHYIPFIENKIDNMKKFTTDYIIIDHLLLKEFIIYYFNYYSDNQLLIEELINEVILK